MQILKMGAKPPVEAPTHVAHHDETRAAVSTTALGVCALRAWESKKPEDVGTASLADFLIAPIQAQYTIVVSIFFFIIPI